MDIYKEFEGIGDGSRGDSFFKAMMSCPSAFGLHPKEDDILDNPEYQRQLEQEFLDHQKAKKDRKKWAKRMSKNPEFLAWYKNKYGIDFK